MNIIDELTQQVRDVLAYSQGIPNPEIDEIMSSWSKNKERFIKLMNNQLIYEYSEPVTFSLSAEGKEKARDNFIYKINQEYNASGIISFLAEVDIEDFYNNLTSKDYTIFYYNKDHICDITIPKGYKMLKALKLFPNNTEDVIKEIQQKASALIQTNCITGTLCLSVHPLDYLSISENTFNWRSCHALDGDHRGGNLGYMADPTTVVCYLKADKDAILPNFPEHILWNNKKWRTLLFISENNDMMFAGRPYPFFSQEGLNYIIKAINTLLKDSFWGEWTENYLAYDSECPNYKKIIPFGTKVRSLSTIIFDEPFSPHYDDLNYSSFYTPQYSYSKNINFDKEPPRITLGHNTKCIYCGKEYVDELMLCYRCLKELYD